MLHIKTNSVNVKIDTDIKSISTIYYWKVSKKFIRL